MLSFQIEWIWVHWCTARPTHLATLVLSCNPVILLSHCHWRSLLCYFPQHYSSLPQPLTSSLIPIHALTSPRLLHCFFRLLSELGSCLWYCACVTFFSSCISLLKKVRIKTRLCILAKLLYFSISGSVPVHENTFPIMCQFKFLVPGFTPELVALSQSAYKSCLLYQNWQLLTPTMALSLTITTLNRKRFPIKPIMCSLNEKFYHFWFFV